jgi:hypothetical protein
VRLHQAFPSRDIDPFLAAALRDDISDSKRTLLFETRNGTPLQRRAHP